jgi:hypothetical protein
MENRNEITLQYKKILIVSISRVNELDVNNDGLLLRNLFSCWPKSKIGQVFSEGSNNEKGYFGSYYKLSNRDRLFGKFFRNIKDNNNRIEFEKSNYSYLSIKSLSSSVFFILKKIFFYTGWYELIFRPRLSKKIKKWISDFEPELILAQGYSITFTKLPILIKNYSGAQLAFLTYDDWPKYLYGGILGESKLMSVIPRFILEKSIQKLMCAVDIPIAFGLPMQIEYTKRYKKKFESIAHCDNYERFENCLPVRLYDKSVFSIITIGSFGKFRYPLLEDLDKCCDKLISSGIDSKVTILSDTIIPEGLEFVSKMKNIEVLKDPGNDNLPCYLKGADLLLLIEGFDENYAKFIELSISTKAHLYMFSKIPIVIYAHGNTGIAKYAKEFGWAIVVDNRNSNLLFEAFQNIYSNVELVDRLKNRAISVALEYHDIIEMQLKFYSMLNQC